MAFVERRGGGSGGGGGDYQASSSSALLRLVLPAVRSSGTLPRFAGVVSEPFSRDDERAPLIPAPAPAPAPAASSDLASSSTSSPWWPSFGRVGDMFHSWSTPGERLRAMDIETGLSSFPDYPPSPTTSRWWQSGRFREGFRAWSRRVQTDTASSPPRGTPSSTPQGTPSSTPQVLPPTVVDAGAPSGQVLQPLFFPNFHSSFKSTNSYLGNSQL